MAVGRERYEKNVIYVGGAPSVKEGYGTMFLLGDDMMYYYEYVAPQMGESRDQFMVDVMMHHAEYDGKMRISFVFASNIIHTLSKIVYPQFLGMNEELEPLPEDLKDEDEWEEGDEAAALEEGDGYPEEEGNGHTSFGMDDGPPEMLGVDPFAGEESGFVTPLAGTENVTHEAVGSVESIADTPIPFELWLFSIKKMGQNFAAANEAYERLSDAEKEALQEEYNATFGL